MRAGLLSDPRVIELLNERLVSTWVLIDELKQYSGPDKKFAKMLAAHWEYPMDLMFLSAEGEFVSKLNSFGDLHRAHPDVGHIGNPFERTGSSHEDVFMQHTEAFLKSQTPRD